MIKDFANRISRQRKSTRENLMKNFCFQGSIVALKLIRHKTRIDVNRLVLMEVKTASWSKENRNVTFPFVFSRFSNEQIKDMQSEYLVRFIGACLDPPCLVNEFCSKGNLQVYFKLEHFSLLLTNGTILGFIGQFADQIRWHVQIFDYSRHRQSFKSI